MSETDETQTNGPPSGEATDETKRHWGRQALIARIALESAQSTAKSKNGEYRAVLKSAKAAGVPPDAITHALANRFTDPDLIVIQERERLKMLDLLAIVPGIRDKVLTRLDIEEPTRNEAHAMSVDRAYDAGCFAGRDGGLRDDNEFEPGSEQYVAWDKGFLDGLKALGKELDPDRTEADVAAEMHATVTSAEG